jgi:curved DNA-binding protein CbpA
MLPQTPGPSAHGDLERRPFPRLMLQLYRKRVTGTASITDESHDTSLLYLREGCAVHIDGSNDLDRLDRILVDTGLVSKAVIARAEQTMEQTGKRLGEVLIELGAVDPRVLHESVRAQLRRKLKRMFFMRKGTFTVTVTEHDFGKGDDFERTRVDPRSLLYQGIRTAYDDARLVAELAPLDGYTFKLIKLPPGFVESMGMSSTDPIVRRLAAGPLHVADIADAASRPAEARAAVLALLYADLLQTERELPDGTRQPLHSTQGLATLSSDRLERAPRMSPLPQAHDEGAPMRVVETTPSVATPVGDVVLRKRIEELHASLGIATHFQLLELSESATPEQVESAYMRAVKTFHPDRLGGMGLLDLGAKAEAIMARLGEGKHVLTDPQRRRDYVRKLRGEKSDTENARDILDAERVFKEGESALLRGDVKSALVLFNQAVQLNHSETEYRAYLAWARYLETPARRSALSGETQRLITEACKDRPHFIRGVFWQGEIHKNMGNLEAAEKAYRSCLEKDPRFIEAERELRLIEMRRKTAHPPEAKKEEKSGGFFNKLLKR